MPRAISERIEELRGDPSNEIAHVSLQVDYQIIEHFSQHLYDSPNKAIEELVANGFDAFATEVLVFTPGRYAAERVLVWDDGESMDVDGLKKLWWIARSPKSDDERVEEREGKKRKIIGKFGIGKLASYAVGNVISHICRHQDEFYVVSIDYATVHGSKQFKAPIIRLTESRAVMLVKSLFNELPASADRMLRTSSWTLAVIEKLKVEDLPSGRLTWVLGNGMPLRPDFAIKVNEEVVSSKLEKKAAVKWDFGATEVVDAIKSRWKDAENRGIVSSSVEFNRQAGLDPGDSSREVPFVRFPKLGLVWGYVRLFDESLLKFRTADHGRSHGFFVIVQGRLINPDDEKLFNPDPSFQSFYRSQFIIFADDLDNRLLADRQRLRQDESVVELEILQRAIAGIARNVIEGRDREEDENQSTHSKLPFGSRIFYRDPLNALLLQAPVESVTDFDPVAVKVERKPLGEDKPISVVAHEQSAFHVNSLHPYYSVLEKRAGRSRAARELLRTFDLFAISERLLEGHLFSIGISKKEVEEIVVWREGLFKRLAALYDKQTDIINEMHSASYTGGRSFEKALCAVLEDMGFIARHDGASGRKDVLVVATVGHESYKFTVEAKGSSHDVSNEQADVSAAARHRDQVEADHAVIIARKFAGFSKRSQNTAALLGECQSTGRVSIMEIESLHRIYESVIKFSYPLPLLQDVFLTLEAPYQKLERVNGLTTPVKGFDYRKLLDQIWHKQGDTAQDDTVPYKSIYQDGGWRKLCKNFEDFQRRVVALETLAAGRIRIDTTAKEVYLRQSPDLILDQIGKSILGEGHDVPESQGR